MSDHPYLDSLGGVIDFVDLIDAGIYQTALENEGIPGGAVQVAPEMPPGIPWGWVHRMCHCPRCDGPQCPEGRWLKR